MKTVLFLAAFFPLLAFSTETKNKYLSVEAPKEFKLVKGELTELELKLNVTPGFHIQANPAARPNLIATTVKVEPVQGFAIGNAQYPPGKPYRLKGADSEISTYDGKLSIAVPLTAEKTLKSGKYKVSGSIRFQACNEENCFFPTTSPFEVLATVR